MSGLLQLLPTYLLARDSNCGTGKLFGVGLYDRLCSGGNVKIEGVGDILIIIGNLIRVGLALAGGLAVVFIIVGGLFYIISAGDPTRIKRAKEILVQAVTGLVVAISGYAVITFISGRI